MPMLHFSLASFLAVFVQSAFAFPGWGPKAPFHRKHLCSSPSGVTDKDNLTTADVLSLASIRSSLIRQEETIIFALIERAQFRDNRTIYKKGGFGPLGVPTGSVVPAGQETDQLSFLEFMLLGTEVLHCSARRYTSPEEHAFFPERLPSRPMEALPSLKYPDDLLSAIGGASDINVNKRLLSIYIDEIVPSICSKGDDEQHGSTALCDISVLQALSRRIHYGKFVAESKYLADPKTYQRLVDADDANGVMELLTNEAVERQVLQRAWMKAATYGTEPLMASLPKVGESSTKAMVAAAAASAVVAVIEALDKEGSNLHGKVDPAVIESVYKNIIIPLTKEVEIAYLYRRCGKKYSL